MFTITFALCLLSGGGFTCRESKVDSHVQFASEWQCEGAAEQVLAVDKKNIPAGTEARIVNVHCLRRTDA
jgi:hypothetical protein